MRHSAILLAVLLSACGSAEPAPGSEPAAGGEASPMPRADDPAYAARFDGTVDERVSTSRGTEDGVVLLWPRVVASGGSGAEAATVQRQLRAIAERLGRTLDVRPEPQRVCPQSGCLGASLGAVLLQSGTGCAVVATISRAGTAPARLVAWAGDVELRQTMVPFREPPEQQVRVVDFAACSDLETSLLAAEPEIEQAIRQELVASSGPGPEEADAPEAE